MTEYIGLIKERDNWKEDLIKSTWFEPDILRQYRENRNSELWRSTRQVEKLCEYILFLEEQLYK